MKSIDNASSKPSFTPAEIPTQHFLNEYQTGFFSELLSHDNDDNVIGRLLTIIFMLEFGGDKTEIDPSFEEDLDVCRAAFQTWVLLQKQDS